MAHKTSTGGTYSHKDPNCRCTPCAARRRKAEALLIPAGTGRPTVATPFTTPTSLSQINADFPLIETKGDSPKERVIQWMRMRHEEPGITNTEIAQRLGINRQYLQAIIQRAVKEGWLKFDDPLSRLEHEIIPQAMLNLSGFLKDNDKMATLETLKGTSFPAYRESKGISDGAQTILALKIETSDPDQVKIAGGTVVGKPRELKDSYDA